MNEEEKRIKWNERRLAAIQRKLAIDDLLSLMERFDLQGDKEYLKEQLRAMAQRQDNRINAYFRLIFPTAHD